MPKKASVTGLYYSNPCRKMPNSNEPVSKQTNYDRCGFYNNNPGQYMNCVFLKIF